MNYSSKNLIIEYSELFKYIKKFGNISNAFICNVNDGHVLIFTGKEIYNISECTLNEKIINVNIKTFYNFVYFYVIIEKHVYIE